MLVFVDESGDPGLKLGVGSSAYLIVTLVVFSGPEEAQAVDDEISLLRAVLHLDPRYEFHFNKCSKKLRVQFLEAVAVHRSSYHAIVINKERLWSEGFKDKYSLYKFASRIVFENAKHVLEDAKVTIDRTGNKDFRKQLARYLKGHLNNSGQRAIKNVHMQPSHTNNLLQLVDMIAGAVSRSFGSKSDADVYRKIVRHREKRVQFWPK